MTETPFPGAYIINESSISHELIDGEVIIIHFSTGSYYSLTGSAVPIWMRLQQAAGHSDLLALFSGNTPQTGEEISHFVSELAREELLVTTPVASSAPSSDGEKAPYQKPEINKYTDMQQLLLADPLHEVEDKGWPHTKEQA